MKSPTISSLAFKLFRSNYLNELENNKIKIPAITGKIYEDIKNLILEVLLMFINLTVKTLKFMMLNHYILQ
jgi:hypothetical protein